MKKKFFALFLIALLCVCLFAGCSSDKGGVIGTVNGQKIYQDEMDYYFAYYFEYYYQNYYSYYLNYMGVDLLDEESAKDVLGAWEQAAWDAAINACLIEQLAAERGLTYEDNYLMDVLPWGDYRAIRVSALNGQLYDAVQQEMLDEMVVDEAEIRAAYDADPTQWDCRKTSQIIIGCDVTDEAALAEAKAQAEDLIQQLKDGADFAELAKEYSTDGTAANGGVLDSYINANGVEVGGTATFFPEYVAAAFSLEKEGDYTLVPVLSEAGYHIIKVDEIRTGYEAAKDLVADSLKSVSEEDLSARVSQLMEEAYANAKINQKFKYRYYEEVKEEVVDDTTDADTSASDVEVEGTDETAAEPEVEGETTAE